MQEKGKCTDEITWPLDKLTFLDRHIWHIIGFIISSLIGTLVVLILIRCGLLEFL